jgi:hypothetical protein
VRAGRPAGQWQPLGLRIEDAAGTGSPEQRRLSSFGWARTSST